jgi:hypothetical protein
MAARMMAIAFLIARIAAVNLHGVLLDRGRSRAGDARIRRRGERKHANGSKREHDVFHLDGFPC